jgi:hypothetical protein
VGKPSILSYRLDPAKPSGVIFGDKTFHPTEPRHLAVNELGALHGFPQSWDWVSNAHRLDVQRGVLPPVGAWLAKHVAAAIRANRVVRKPARALVDFRRPPGVVQGVLALPAGVDLDWKPGHPVRPGRGGPRTSPEARSDRPAAPGPSQKPKRTPAKGKKPRPIRDLGDVRGVSRAILAALAKGVRPRTSGELIRARVLEAKLDDDAIAAEVRKLWAGRTTSKSDVNWNRTQLRKAGAL